MESRSSMACYVILQLNPIPTLLIHYGIASEVLLDWILSSLSHFRLSHHPPYFTWRINFFKHWCIFDQHTDEPLGNFTNAHVFDDLITVYQIRKLVGCAWACQITVMHVPWCMPGSYTDGGGESVPGISGACTTSNFTYLAIGPYRVVLKCRVETSTHEMGTVSWGWFSWLWVQS